jgi:predicted secreted hydrolase
MKTSGELTIEGEVLTVEGISWMDHEFGSSQLQTYQVGWDWFSIQMDNDTELMLYVIRHGDGTSDPYSSGTFIHPDGTSCHIRLEEFEVRALKTWKSRKTGARYPARWNIRVPSLEIELTVTPTLADQELITRESTRVTYWEGSVKVDGRYRGKSISGVGYVELTGYAEPMGGKV